MRILIAEGNRQQADTLRQLLSGAQYEVVCASGSSDALQETLHGSYDLLITEVSLPGPGGLTVIRELRRYHVHTPVLILSSLSSVSDRVAGLDAGADDYLTKPYAAEELLARVRALTRRYSSPATEPSHFGDLYFCPENVSIVCADQEIRLNYKESEIFKLLLSSPQRIISKDELIRRIWGYSATTSDNNVEAYISFLRKKLRLIGSQVQIIAIKKQGYKLV